MRFFVLTTLLCSALAVGCASNQGAKLSAPKSPAEQELERGIQATKDKNYEEAKAHFDLVIAKYPFLDVARIAELRLADLAYEKEEYPEARDKYQQFVKLHPTHPDVDYAAFRAAMTNYKEIPGDLFILPPSYEKDQTPVKNALRAFEDFVRQHPKSPHIEEAKSTLADIRQRLCKHELYVAGFYAKRDKWLAVVTRLNNIVQNFSGAGYDEQALFGIHDAYVKMHDQARAKDTLKRIISSMPGTKAAEKAQRILGG